MEKGLSKQEIIAQLTKAVHGGSAGKAKKGEKQPKLSAEQKIKARVEALMAYYNIGAKAVQEDGEFFSKLIAWNHVKGSVRDSKVALPAIALKFLSDPEYKENALAHIADLRPREFMRSIEFARAIKAPQRTLDRLVERYLRDLEANPAVWDRVALLHGDTLRKLYRLAHVKPAPYADAVLFDHPDRLMHDEKGRVVRLPQHEALALLPNLSAIEIAGTIMRLKIPLLVAKGALGKKAADPDVLCALIGAMTPAQLTTNMTWLERLGVKTIPAARAALEKKLEEAATAKGARGAALKATAAAEAVEDEALSGKLKVLQEKQLDALGIEGNWLVIGDKSSSMSRAIDASRVISGLLARLVKGKVHLVFHDSSPRYFDATGKTMEEIAQITRGVAASGNTSIGVALDYCVRNDIAVDGIAVVGDGEENQHPYFEAAYKAYVQKFGNEPTIYFYWVAGSGEPFTRNNQQHGVQVFDLRSGVDSYAVPNLIQTMRVGRYSLLDEVMAQDLKTVNMVLENTHSFKATCLPAKKAKRVKA